MRLVDARVADGTVTYAFAPDWRELAGPLGFTFHTVQREGGERFNVPWAVDFLLLVSSDHPDERVEVFDSCAHCTDRIHAVIEGAAVLQVDPPEALVFRGGGWRDNNLFRSEGHLTAWLADHPELADADDNAARRRWLEEFPGLANSNLGRGLRDTTRPAGAGGGARAARLIDFYASELFAGMATDHQARLAELRAGWRSD